MIQLLLGDCRDGMRTLDAASVQTSTGAVAIKRDRSFVGCELNPEYVTLARERIRAAASLGLV